MQWVQHHPASLPDVPTSEAAWASMPKKHQEQTSKEEELTSASASDLAEQTSQKEKLTSRNRWQTSREELTSVAKEPSRATIGIRIAQTKDIESIDCKHRVRRVDIKVAPMRASASIADIEEEKLTSAKPRRRASGRDQTSEAGS